MPFYYADPAIQLLTSLASRGTMVAMRRFSVSRFWEVVTRYDATEILSIASIPALLMKGEPGPAEKDHRIRLAIHALPRAVTALFRTTLPTQLAYRVATLTEVNGSLVRPEDFMPYLEHMAQVDPRLFIDMLAAAGRHTARELLSSVNVPTLILAGDQDGFTPLSLSEEMHRLVPGSRLHIVRGGSHTAPIERPREVGRAVGDFLHSLA